MSYTFAGMSSPQKRTWVALGLSFALLASGELRAEGIADCGLEPPGMHLAPPVRSRPKELLSTAGEPPRVVRLRSNRSPFLAGGLPSARLRSGALTGKTVYVGAGHGFYANGSSKWATQRGNTNGIVEDLVSTEVASQYLIPLLLNAGATVVPVREFDTNPNLVIVDDAAPGYSESGDPAAFSDSSDAAYGAPALPLTNGVNPFELGRNRLMESTVGATPTASATWVPDVPEAGEYNVYVSYTQFIHRVPDAHFVVRHAGGEAHFRINQRRHGSTWVFLGRFHFRAGASPERGAVVALNDSTVQGNVSLDAVRLGGGMGLQDTRGGGTSGRPRFEESARYHAQFAGAPESVYDNPNYDDRTDDVSARSRFVDWEHEEGEDAAYVAWHTNACGGTTCNARGTETYVYGTHPPDGTYQFSGVSGSDVLAQKVHAEMVKDLQSGFDATWRDRGLKSAYFGELNPIHNDEVPAILIEVGFHQNPTDAERLKQPQFRYTAARGIVQGLIGYFAEKDGVAAVLPPEAPVQVSVRHVSEGRVEVSWVAEERDSLGLGGDAATSFIVYQSDDGVAWDDGTGTMAPSFTRLLEPGQTRYFRVASVNAGGESFPSDVVGVRVPTDGVTPVLVVNGFDRLDASLGREEDLATFGLGAPLRVRLSRMNDGTYVRRHGQAISASGIAFDSATNEAVRNDRLRLEDYAVVDWFVGRGGAVTQLTAEERVRLRAHADAGGRILLSGSSVTSALAHGDADEQAFAVQVLQATATPGGGGLAFDGVAGGLLEGFFGVQLDDGLQGSYPTGLTDALGPAGANAIATWSNGSIAAVVGETPGIALLAFPLEGVISDAWRAHLTARLLGALGLQGTPLGPLPEHPITFPQLPDEYPSADAQGCGCTSGGGSVSLFALALALFVLRFVDSPVRKA